LAARANRYDKVVNYLTVDYNNPKAVRLIFRALVIFTLLKIAMVWPLSHKVMSHHSLSLPRSWPGKIILAPAFLANYSVDLFFIVVISFLVATFIVRINYAITAIFFWVTFNLYIVVLPFANGSDLVLFMLALWCIPQAIYPRIKSAVGKILQTTAFNLSTILCQMLVVFIYLVSGVDKIASEVWRSGVAFEYIINLKTLYNPLFVGLFENELIQKLLSWITIGFELAFVVLVWIERTRLPILAVGIIFHLFIWIVLSLPDFALMMMISYVIFLKDEDIIRFRAWLKP
jgi:hypothetical protein